jgi:outer membrane protein
MRTARQIEASRLNGARSRGPVTAAGKRKSSRNSRSHGLYAKTVEPEDIPACVTEATATFRVSLEAEYPPGDATNFASEGLIESVVQAYGHLRQIVALETTVMNREIARQRLAHPDESNLTLQALAFKRLSDETGTLQLIDRLETKLFAHFEIAIDRLRFLGSPGFEFAKKSKNAETNPGTPVETEVEKIRNAETNLSPAPVTKKKCPHPAHVLPGSSPTAAVGSWSPCGASRQTAPRVRYLVASRGESDMLARASVQPARAQVLLLAFTLSALAQNNAAPATSPEQAATFTRGRAIEATLRDHPLLHAQEQQVQFNRGALLRAQSQFDRVLSADGSAGRTYTPLTQVERTLYGASSATTNLATVDAAMTQQFHNGITAGPLLTVSRTTDNVFTQLGLNQSHLGYQINVPLLRGRGRDVVGAQETASGMEVEASLLDLNQTISDLLVNTAVAYWSAVAAHRSLEVFREAEARGRVMLSTVQALIAGDKIPRSEVSAVQANLADRTASRIAADQQLLQANQQLAVAMGVSAENMFAVGEPGDAMPSAPPADSFRPAQAFIPDALRQRADFLATQKRRAEADLLANAAKNQLKPQLDIQFSAGYSGLREGTAPYQFLDAPFSGVHGVDATGGIRYQFPMQNRAAEANVMQARSTAVQADYKSQDAARNISSSVIVAVEGVRSAIRQREATDRSVAFFRTALDNEREKYRLGIGSIIEVLTVEDRLTTELTAQVQAELGYAVAIAKMRQATGSIVAPDKVAQNIDPAVFLTAPEASR